MDTGSAANRFSKNAENDLGKIGADLTFVLDEILEGVCRPFKVRVEQVLQPHEPATMYPFWLL